MFCWLPEFSPGAPFSDIPRGRPLKKSQSLFNKETPSRAEIDFSPFWVSWNTIKSKYAASDGFDDQKMVWGAIQGLVKSLGDPYSVFFPPQESKQFKEEMQGGFEGVGMEIAVKNNVLTVVAPLKERRLFGRG